MIVGIIIHGKPNEGSHKDVDVDSSLRAKIVEGFFGDLGHRPAVALLIADARYWQSKWYSVYTFWCGSNGVKDRSDRNSFIALTVVLDGYYCPHVSDMYNHLKQVYERCVVGTYVQNGKYLVNDLNNPGLFDSLVQCIMDDFPATTKPFDNTFQQQANLADGMEYNIVDCDAMAFVNDWKRRGRIIISPQATTKEDSYKACNDELNRRKEELDVSKKKHKEKDEQIQTLTTAKTTLETELSSSKQSKGELSNEVNALKGKVAALEKQCQAATNVITEIAGVVTAYAKEAPSLEAPSPKTTPSGETMSLLDKMSKWLNTMLLLLILVGIGVFAYKAFTPDKAAQAEMAQMKEQITEMHGMLAALPSSADEAQQDADISSSETASPGTSTTSAATAATSTTASQQTETKDIDCNITVSQDGKEISKNGGTIDFSQPLRITIGLVQQGYDIHTDNISNRTVVKSNILNNKEVNINPEDPSKEVVICYRSAKYSNAHNNNRITLKQKQ